MLLCMMKELKFNLISFRFVKISPLSVYRGIWSMVLLSLRVNFVFDLLSTSFIKQ